ncbi:MAG: hypothetical protein J2P17_36435, partial [Mycobacterium sp.]|nr:hypothetical protein [Mycobacterium sp.]
TFAEVLHGQASTPEGVDCDMLPDASEGPIVVVTAPVAGNTYAAGPMTIQGAAFDCAADTGTGVDRVSVFLGAREAGGIHLGEATLRQASPVRVMPSDQYATAGWSLTSGIPLNSGQPNDVYVYARSDVNSHETAVRLTLLGAPTDDTPTPPTAVPTVVPPTLTTLDPAPQTDTVPTGPADDEPPAE